MSKSVLFFAVFVAFFCDLAVVQAHPLDSFATDQYVDVRFQPDKIRLIHRIEFAEIPTIVELPRVDRNSNLALEDEETGPYLQEILPTLLDELTFSVNKVRSEARFTEGRVFLDGLPVPRLRVVSSYEIPMPVLDPEGTAFEFFLRHRTAARGDRQVRLICQGKMELREVWCSEPITPIGMAPPFIGDATALLYGHVTRWNLVPSEIEHQPSVPAIQSGTTTIPARPNNPFFGLNPRGFEGDLEASFPFEQGDMYTAFAGGGATVTTASTSAVGGGDRLSSKEVESIYERSAQVSESDLSQEARPEFADGKGKESQETWADRQFRSLFTSNQGEKGVGFLLFATLLSLIYGAAHAMEPGHGKTIVGAYLVGSKGTVYHAVLLALIVTFTHTFSVYILGVIALTNLDRVQGTYLPILECGSWALIIVMGVWLFLKYYKAYVMGLLADPTYHSHGFGPGHTHGPETHTHDHEEGNAHAHDHSLTHDHPHPHPHAHPHDHDHGHEHQHHNHPPPHEHGHSHEHKQGEDHGHHHDHDHAHPHPHDHGHNHDHGHDHHHHDHPHPHKHKHEHVHEAGHSHDHHHPHEPQPVPAPQAAGKVLDDAREVSFWNLLVLGMTGGIVPCPGALFVMMMALASGAPAVGLYLIAVFSVGLALMLMMVGIVMVKSKSIMGRFTPNNKFVQVLPVLSSLVIIFVGAGFFFAGLLKHGILRFGQ